MGTLIEPLKAQEELATAQQESIQIRLKLGLPNLEFPSPFGQRSIADALRFLEDFL